MTRINGYLVTDLTTPELIYIKRTMDAQRSDVMRCGHGLHPKFGDHWGAVHGELMKRSFNDVPQAELDKFGYPDMGDFAHD